MTFTGGNGTLRLDDPSHFTGTIARITGTGNVLDLDGFAAAATTAATGSGSYHSDTNTTTLTVTDTSDNTTATLKLAGDLSAVELDGFGRPSWRRQYRRCAGQPSDDFNLRGGAFGSDDRRRGRRSVRVQDQ